MNMKEELRDLLRIEITAMLKKEAGWEDYE
jgi:hypothetical protein